jgi:hypothetical protein
MAASDIKEPKAQWQAEVELPEYTLKDVAAHNTKKDTWIVIHGQGLIELIHFDRSSTDYFQFSISQSTVKIIPVVQRYFLKSAAKMLLQSMKMLVTLKMRAKSCNPTWSVP